MATDRRNDRRPGGNGPRKTGGTGYGKERFQRDEAYDGRSTRPGREESFFLKGGKPQGRDAKHPARYTPDKPYGKPAQGGRTYGRPARADGVSESSPRDGRPYGKPVRGDRHQPEGERYSKPYGKGAPRPAAPTHRPIPPAVQDEQFGAREAPFEPRREDALPENLLIGRNPIREAIRSGRSIEKLLVAGGELSGSAREIVAKAREAGVVVQVVDRSRLDAVYEKHQGMLAYVSAAEYSTVEDILNRARELGEDPFVIVLDGVTDPHNLGAIIRTAECVGAHGVIIPERRSAGLNPAAVKAAAGALEYIKVARVVNLTRTLDELKKAGLWIIGGTMDGQNVESTDMSGPIALVVGAEGDGISQLVQKQLDVRVTLPLRGKIESLNASVAAGVLMYCVLRSRER